MGRAEQRRGRRHQPRRPEGRRGVRADELPAGARRGPVRHRQLRCRRRPVRRRAGRSARAHPGALRSRAGVARVPAPGRGRARVGARPRRRSGDGVDRRARAGGRRPDRRHHDDLHVGHHRSPEGHRAARHHERGRLGGVHPDGRLGAHRRVPVDRAALPLGPARVHAGRAGPRRLRGRAAPLRRRGLAPPRRDAQGHHVVLGAHADPAGGRPPGGGAGQVRLVVDAAAHRQRGAVAVRAEEEVRRAGQRLLAVRGLRLHRAGREHDAHARATRCGSRARAAARSRA